MVLVRKKTPKLHVDSAEYTWTLLQCRPQKIMAKVLRLGSQMYK